MLIKAKQENFACRGGNNSTFEDTMPHNGNPSRVNFGLIEDHKGRAPRTCTWVLESGSTLPL
jgi:hypothetical protein